MRYTYDFPRPGLTVDLVVVRSDRGVPEVLCVLRGEEPYAGQWALPGGFVHEMEPLHVAALRELAEETGVQPTAELAQFGAFGDPGRDPRGWTVTVGFAVALDESEARAADGTLVAGDDAAEAAWFSLCGVPTLAFDHDLVLAAGMRRLGLA